MVVIKNSHDSIGSFIEPEPLPTQPSTLKVETKFRRRSSLARAASSVIATFETSRNWFSSSVTNNNNGKKPSLDKENKPKDDITSNDDIPYRTHLQLQYTSDQAHMQALARKMDLEGHFDPAIECWKQSLILAERNRDLCSLSDLTEVLCALVNLHFRQSKHFQRLENEPNTTGDTSVQQRQSSSSDEEIVVAGAHHNHEARQYLTRIKCVMVQDQWLHGSVSFMEFLCEAEAWELALIVAKKIAKKSKSDQRLVLKGNEIEIGHPSEQPSFDVAVQPMSLAIIHFKVASIKLENRKQGEALQHLQTSIQYFKKVQEDQRDMSVYLKALHLLAAEYQHQGQLNLALESYKEQQKYLPPDQCAHVSCLIAEIYITDCRLDMALEELESAYEKYEGSDTRYDEDRSNKGSTIGAIRSQLLQVKGEVYCRLGKMDDSMKVYKQALQEVQNPAEKAKLLYMMGRLYTRMGRIQCAISCFMQELEVTERELGINHLSVSTIYHELAKLYDEGPGLHRVGIQKYDKALQIEIAVMEDISSAVGSCIQCDIDRMCEAHAAIHTQVEGQIRETKKSMGRIHFKLGDFDGAMKAGLTSDQI